MSLEEYQGKRDFSKTPEPKSDIAKKCMGSSIFVVQRHAATHLHYDFRLEVDGVLKSWAVPKGLPEGAKDKRLAIETEDHPLEYASFSGTIPKGEYGGGNVEIWDKGTFDNITKKDDNIVPIAIALQDGHIDIALHGKKFNGEFTLIVFKKEKNNRHWFIIKKS